MLYDDVIVPFLLFFYFRLVNVKSIKFTVCCNNSNKKKIKKKKRKCWKREKRKEEKGKQERKGKGKGLIDWGVSIRVCE